MALGLALVLAVLAVYWPAVRGGFIWDDDTHVTNNLVLKQDGLYRTWLTREHHNYWPLTWTAIWIQWHVWGPWPTGFHLVAILLHAACALLVWRILWQLRIPGAWLAAAAFALHPVNVETGAWITQQKNLLSMGFGLLALSFYLRADETPHRGFSALAVLAFLLSLLSKTAMVTLPVVLLGCAWWRRGRVGVRDVVRSLPFFGLTIVFSLLEVWFQYHRALAAEVRTDTLVERAAVAGWAFVFYLSKLLVPAGLCFVYPTPAIDAASLTTWTPHAAGVLLLIACVRTLKTWGRPVLFALGYYAVSLLPVLGFLNIYFMKYSWAADHWQYMASVGPLALLAAACVTGLPALCPSRPALAMGIPATLLIVLAGLSAERSAIFADRNRIWEDTLAKNPASWMAHNNYGLLLLEQGDPRGAVPHLEAALRLRPGSMLARFNLARAWGALGRRDEGRQCLEAGFRLDPQNVALHYELGRWCFDEGRRDEAEGYFKKAVELDPSFGNAWVALGLIRQQAGDVDGGLALVQRALDLNAENADALHAQGDILYGTGRLQPAYDAYLRTLKAAPVYAGIHNDLGVTAAQLGRTADAVRHFEQAVARDPQNNATLGNLQRAQAELMQR